MNVSLTPELEKMIREKVSSGLYNSSSEVVREALRLLFGGDGRPAGPASKAEIRRRILYLEKPLREEGVSSLSLFGSVVRGETGPQSDVDVFIDIDPRARFTLLNLVGVKNILEDGLRREVDVAMREGLDPKMKEGILKEAEKIF